MKFLYKIKNNLWSKVLPITVLGLTAASCTVTQTASRETDGIYYDPSTAVAEEPTVPENNLVRIGGQYFNTQGEAPTVYTDKPSYSENVYTQDNSRYAQWGEEENDISININNYGAFGGYYGMYSPYYYGSGFYFGIGSVYRPLGFYTPYYPSYPFGGYYGYNPYYGGYYSGFYNPYNPYYPYSPYNGYYGNGYYGGYNDYPNYYVPGRRVVRERGRGNTNNVPVNRENASQVRSEQGQNNGVYIRDRRNRNMINQNSNPSVRSNSNNNEVRTIRERRVYPQERRREAPVRYNNNSDNTIRNRRSDNNINRRQSAPSINRGSINNGNIRSGSSNNVRRR